MSSLAHNVDVIILGQGLAGTALAWQCHWRGLSTFLIDAGTETTSSKIAAGLITPITGKRLATDPRYRQYFDHALPFYSRIEEATRSRFVYRRPVVRLFQTPRESQLYQARNTSEFHGLIHEETPVLSQDWYRCEHGAFAMSAAAQLDVPRLLTETRKIWEQHGRHLIAQVDITKDIQIANDAVTLPKWNVQARWLILCQGYVTRQHHLFADIPFTPARGDILTLRVPGFTEDRVINAGVWLAPTTTPDQYRMGSTYDREHLDLMPRSQDRVELLGRLGQWLRPPVEVLQHDVAIRPIVVDREPCLGLHPQEQRLGVYNGLGSKGSLIAPYFARLLADHLVSGTPIPEAVHCVRFLKVCL